MSAKPDSRLIQDYESAPLSDSNRRRLHFLGWKDADLAQMTVPEALGKIQTNSAKPGSKAFLKQQVNPLTGEKGVDKLVGEYADEAIEARNATRPAPSGADVQVDEFTNACLKASTERFVMDEYSGRVTSGADPLNAMLYEMEERYCRYEDGFDSQGKRTRVRIPTRRFRWAHKDDPTEPGPQPDPVYDANRKLVTNGELFMVWMPVDVWKEGRQEPQLARSRAMTGAIERNKSDVMRTTDEVGPTNEGRLEMGRSDEFYA